MAKEYKCVRCGKPAVVHITKISGNEKLTLHFCEECAKKFALDDPTIPTNVDPEIKKFEDAAMKKKLRGICPTCGSIAQDLKKGDKPACADCYSIMDDAFLDVLTQMHGATVHTGKKPKHHNPNIDTTDIYRRRPDFFGGDFLKNLEDVVNSAMESVSQAQLAAQKAPVVEPDVPQKQAAKPLAKGANADKNAPADSPKDERAQLEAELAAAIAQERYEDAAKIRDKINSLSKPPNA